MVRILIDDDYRYYEYLGHSKKFNENDLLNRVEDIDVFVNKLLKDWNNSLLGDKIFDNYYKQCYEDSIKPLIPFATKYNQKDGYLFIYETCIIGCHVFKRIK